MKNMGRFLFVFLLTISMMSQGTLAQKKLAVIGDSYVANHRQSKTETWHCQMAQDLELEYSNHGRNGSCVAFDRTHDGKWNFGPAMWVRYTELPQDADYVLIIAGHNDACKCGTNQDSLQMFADSLEVLLTNIERHCPKAKIGYVTPWYVDQSGFKQVAGIIQKTCKRHHIPVLCNYSKRSPIKVRQAEFRKRYFQGENDNAHLNAEGHKLFLPIGEAWFRKHVLRRR